MSASGETGVEISNEQNYLQAIEINEWMANEMVVCRVKFGDTTAA
jgi:hypothetical protein